MAEKKFNWRIASDRHKKILELLRAGFGIRRVASSVGVGVRTVQRRAEVLRLAEIGEGEIDYRRTTKASACPVHGPVNVWPCVACAATALVDQRGTVGVGSLNSTPATSSGTAG